MAHTRRSFLVGIPAVTATALVAPAWLAGSAGATLPQQSPIHLHSARAVPSPELPALRVRYPHEVDLEVRYVSRDGDDPDGCTTRDREETVEAAVPPGTAWITLGGVRYDLLQFHFHTRSEHVLDGRRFPLEQHFVHAGPDGETLVIGLFLTGGGRGGTAADRVLGTLPAECADTVAVPRANLSAALPRELSTFRYPGSLTTSPNTEGVAWLVLAEAEEVSTAALRRFRGLFPDGDSRELQPLNGRTVRFRAQH